ncbi:glycosyl transferase, group 1 [Thermofilum pendens Hrk 5]|uniref:Glycosyl transferase, group 1 n=2 Tax=Thermofilum pendens TaxID=2269 RepID=A1S0Y6_THEPD|nr:glycosyl transferase, group 1 [Thermofilum pendens Hrk 5]
MGSINKNKKTLLFISAIVGSTGDVINEWQVAMSLAKHARNVFIIAPVGLRYVISREYKKYLLDRPSNTRIILLPFALLPSDFLYLMNLIIFIFYSLMIYILTLTLDMMIHFDIIYVRDSRLALLLAFSPRLARKCFVKIAAILEDGIYQVLLRQLTLMLINSIDRHVLERTAGIITHSADFAKSLVLRKKVLPKRIIVIPPGIMLNTVKIVRRICRRKTKTENEVTVGFLGFLAPWQGVDMLCSIVAELNRLGYKAKLKVVGDGPLKRQLLKECTKLGVPVEITGFVSHPVALCIARRDFDVMVLPRVSTETTATIMPIKVIEALALGIPVVATELPVYESSAFREKGLYTSRRDPKAFAETIARILRESGSDTIKLPSFDLFKPYLYDYSVKRFIEYVSEG